MDFFDCLCFLLYFGYAKFPAFDFESVAKMDWFVFACSHCCGYPASQLATPLDRSCYLKFSASGMVCQVRLLAATVASHKGKGFKKAYGFVEKLWRKAVEMW